MTLTLNTTYLNFPVTKGAKMRRMRMRIGDQCVREFDIELAEGKPDFWVFLDVTELAGSKATFEVDPPIDNLVIKPADAIEGAADLYREKRRSQVHFSSRRGWNNDPNGLVYYDGEYHLFYQHNPYGWNWGNMHWGHAVSTDLVHWKELPIAIYPDRLGTIFSGSAAVDEANTAGFQTGRHKPIVAVYTYAGQPFTQGIAYSNDRGRTWTKFAGNPVIGNLTGGGDRDPRILWHEPTGQWVLVLYLDEKDKARHAFFTSPDLKTWKRHGEIAGFFECPDLFELPVDGDPSNTRWVIYGGAGDYMLGRFDGTAFTPECDRQPFNRGNGFYAAQTFSNIPAFDGRRIQIGWGQTITEGMPFNQMMLFPTVLTLRSTADGIRMCAEPVAEVRSIHGKTHAFSGKTVGLGDNPLAGIQGDLFDIAATFAPGGAAKVGFNVRGVSVAFDAAKGELTCLDKRAPLAPKDGTITLRLLIDRNSIEIFANGGLVYMPMAVKFDDAAPSLAMIVEGGKAKLPLLEVRELKSIWR